MKRVILAIFIFGAASLVPHSALAQEPDTNLKDFTLTLTGDALIMAPVTVYQNDPQFKGLLDVIREIGRAHV